MKRKLISMAVALLCSVGMWADVAPTPSTPTAGNTYYLYNPATKKFLFISSRDNIPYVQLEGNAWDLLESDKSGYIKIRQKSNDTGYFWGKYWAIVAGDYANYNNETYFQINEVSAGSTYKLHPNSWDGTNTAFVYINTANGCRVACNSQEQSELDEKYTIWQFIAEDDYAEYMSQKYGTDVSSKVTNTTFESNVNGWTRTGTFQNSKQADNQNGAFDGKFWENWDPNASINKMYQDVTLTANGVYTLRMAAFVNNLGSSSQYVFANSDKTYLTTTVPTFYEVQTLVKNKNISIGLDQTAAQANWMGIDNVRLFYLGNNVEYYSPTSTTSSTSATADTWYELSVSGGWYRIESSAAATLYYTQDDSNDADNTASKTFTAGGYTFMSLTAGSFYFKSSATSTIKIEAISSSVLKNGDVVTDVFLTNPSFENDEDGWTDSNNAFSISTNSDLSNKDGEKYEYALLNTTRSLTQNSSALVAGTYVLSVNARLGSYNSNIGTATIGLGGNTTPIQGDAAAATYTVAYEAAANATPAVTFSRTGAYTYHYFDNFTLTYYSTLPDVSGVDDLLASAMDADVRAALVTANTNYTGSKTVAYYNALQTAIVNAKTSIAAFAANTGADADWTGVIQNPSFETGNYNGWTTTASDDTQAADNSNAIYTMSGVDGSYVFNTWATGYTISQTLKNMPAGSYKLTAVMGTDAGATFRLKMGDETGYATSVDKGTGVTVTVYAKLAAKGDLTISADAGGSMWYKVDNFQLTYNPTLPGSVTAVEGKMNTTVASTQTSAVSAYNATSGQTIDNMVDAQAAIYAAYLSKQVYTEITTIKSNYDDKADALDAIGKAAYEAGASATQYTNGTYTTASEAETAYHNDYIAAVKSQDTEDAVYTDVIDNPSFEDGKTGWSWYAASGESNWDDDSKVVSGSLVVGGGAKYLGFWTNCATGSKVKQTVNLPAGSYKLSAYLKPKTAGDVLTLSAKDQTTSKTTEDTNAFKMEVSFSITSTQDVEISAGTTTASGEYWMDDFQLILTSPYYANAGDYAALNSAIESAEEGTLGFEVGEYAPYNIARARAINQATNNERTVVVAATEALAANTEEVNAIAGGYNLDSFTNDGEYDRPNGWTNAGYNTRIVGISESLIGSNPGLGGAVNERAILMKYGTTYGETTGYTLPLKAGTVYELSFTYGLWNEAGEIIKDLSLTDPDEETINVYPGSVSKNEGDKTKCANVLTTAWATKSVWFKTTTAGNYVLNFINHDGNNQRQMVFSGLMLKKAVASDLAISQASSYTPEYGYFDVTLTRTIKVGHNTLVLPFDMSQTEVEEQFGTGSKVFVVDSYADGKVTFTDRDGIQANQPVLLKATEAGTSYTINSRDVKVGSITDEAEDGSVSMIGSYENEITITADNDNYFIYGDKLYLVDGESTVKLKNTRAYFNIPSALGVKSLTMSFDDDIETAISTTENGELKIENAPVYNLSGQRVSKAQKGIYIVNGKKIVKK